MSDSYKQRGPPTRVAVRAAVRPRQTCVCAVTRTCGTTRHRTIHDDRASIDVLSMSDDSADGAAHSLVACRTIDTLESH